MNIIQAIIFGQSRAFYRFVFRDRANHEYEALVNESGYLMSAFQLGSVIPIKDESILAHMRKSIKEYLILKELSQ